MELSAVTDARRAGDHADVLSLIGVIWNRSKKDIWSLSRSSFTCTVKSRQFLYSNSSNSGPIGARLRNVRVSSSFARLLLEAGA